MTTERPWPAKVYTMADLEPIMQGKLTVPNFEEVPISEGVANIAAGGGMVGQPDIYYAKVPGAERGAWSRFFLSTCQGGGLDGTGYVMWYSSGNEASGYKAYGRVARFRICQHKFVLGPGANPQRGWNPGWCAKCGLDMSIDSGD